MINKAVRDFREKYKNEIAEYYRYVIRYIDDLVKTIVTADFSAMIRGEYVDVEMHQKLLKHFNIKYENIIEFLGDECIRNCYIKLESTITDFVDKLERCADRLKNEFECFIPDDYKVFVENCKSYIESPELKKAIKLHEKYPSEVNQPPEINHPLDSLIETMRFFSSNKPYNFTRINTIIEKFI